MELQITGRNLDITPELRQYIERKLGKLGRHLPNILETKVEIFEEKTKSRKDRFVVQVTVDSSGTLLRSEERGDDLFMAIDKTTAVMERQMEHYKGKLQARRRDSSRAKEKFNQAAEAVPPPAELVRVKRFTVKPMYVDEAIDRMELLGHDFFLFLNSETEGLNLLYRRKEGNYGLIKPEIE